MIKKINKKVGRLFPYLDKVVVARYFLKGNGIEIGALHNPLKLSGSAKVKYVDRLGKEDLVKQYPEIKKSKLVHIDYIADGELLESVPDNSQDFVIASHFLEHCQNPILAIENMLRILKDKGMVFLAIPDKRYTFDIDREITTIEHLVKDYKEGPQISKLQHFKEWVTYVEKIKGQEEIDKRVNYLLEKDYSIHFHVWTQSALIDLFTFLRKEMNFNFEIELLLKKEENMENIFILRKSL